MDWMPYAWVCAATLMIAGLLMIVGLAIVKFTDVDLEESMSAATFCGWMQFAIGCVLAAALGLIHLGAWLATGAAT